MDHLIIGIQCLTYVVHYLEELIRKKNVYSVFFVTKNDDFVLTTESLQEHAESGSFKNFEPSSKLHSH